jgi:hypothetical protein
MWRLGTSIAQPSNFQTTICLRRASSPAAGECSWLAARGPAATPGGRAVPKANPRPFYILRFGAICRAPPGHSSQPSQASNFRALDFLPILKSAGGSGLHKDGRCKASGGCDLKPRSNTLEHVWIYLSTTLLLNNGVHEHSRSVFAP